MNDKIDVLGVNFDKVTMDEAVKQTLDFFEGQEARRIYTANPEIVMAAVENPEFMDILNKGDLVVADGIGVVIGAKWLKKPLPERVPGYDLVQNIFSHLKDMNKTVYFFGAAPGVAAQAAEKMREVHPGLKIVGTHDGYFDAAEEEKMIEEIRALQPDLLLVGLGAPRQEKWLYQHQEALRIPVGIGVGGSFDTMSGNLKRAPKLFIRLNLEWLYRLLLQPTRFKRTLKLPLFLLHVLKYKRKK